MNAAATTPPVPGDRMRAQVIAVARDGAHGFSKHVMPEIHLRADYGVDGDAHGGATVQHLSRVRVDPSQPNLRQVHLLHAELFDELAGKGLPIAAGALGENITTRGLALLELPRRTRLRIGATAVLEVTGLRNPCAQIEAFRPGLLAEVLQRDADGGPIRKAGIMAVVHGGGPIRPGDPIAVQLPPAPHLPLERV